MGHKNIHPLLILNLSIVFERSWTENQGNYYDARLKTVILDQLSSELGLLYRI